ncbi:hypothetical protein ACKWTF_013189 [Chironomus riparius]
MEEINCFVLQQNVMNILKNAETEDFESKIKLQFDNTEANIEISDKKSAVEHALRDVLIKNCVENIETVEKIVDLSMKLARQDIISAFFPVSLLVDVFDVKTLDFCENLFTFVEQNVNVFKEPHFFTPCKNSLLRMCNDLLRRLSRSQNTVFCGRILMFLAKFFPFSERSGLNIVSEFNVENITEFEFSSNVEGTDEIPQEPESMAVEDPSTLKVDKHLYLKFWALQEFFRCPYTCYDKEKFKKFAGYTKDVLAAFKSFKLEETGELSSKSVNEIIQSTKDSEQFFAKFLTNPKLLSLQLGDSNFRRTILVQYLILFQYLVSTIKFKGENDKLNNTQQDYVKETESLVYKLLNETPPRGKEFSEAIKHILKREEMWNNWKNDGCKEIKRPEGHEKEVPESRKRKLLGEEICTANKLGKFDLGNPELTRLWNLCPDNLQACKGLDRNFLPPLETYLENKEMSSDDPTYLWRALRLVSKQSSHFFTLLAPPNEKIEKIADYLKLFSQKIQKDKIEIKQEAGTGIDIEQAEAFVEEHVNSEQIDDVEPEDENPHKAKKATPEQIVEIAKAIGDDWQKLGKKLGLEKDVIEYFVVKKPDAPCELLLTQLFEENDDEDLESLAYTLEGMKVIKAANLVKKMCESEETMQVE